MRPQHYTPKVSSIKQIQTSGVVVIRMIIVILDDAGLLFWGPRMRDIQLHGCNFLWDSGGSPFTVGVLFWRHTRTHASLEIWSEMLIYMVYAWFKVYFHSLFSGTILICNYYFYLLSEIKASVLYMCVCFDYLKWSISVNRTEILNPCLPTVVVHVPNTKCC